MNSRPALSAITRPRKVQDYFYLGHSYVSEGSTSTSTRNYNFASSSRHLKHSSPAHQQQHVEQQPLGQGSDASNKEVMLTPDISSKRSTQRPNDSLVRRREERSRVRRAKSQKHALPTDIVSWRQHMNATLVQQEDQRDVRSSARKRSPQDTARKAERSETMARTMELSRSKQPDASPPDDGQRIISARPIFPGGGGNNGFPLLHFETTEIRYPPQDVYPPHLPSVREVDLLTAARALGVIKNCEIEWNAKDKIWRKTSRSTYYYEQQGLIDYLDNEQALEYIGDSILETISKALIMSQFPGKTVAVYNVAASWLKSNECFSYMFEDSGLEAERIDVAKTLMGVIKKREIEGMSNSLTSQEKLILEEAPCPKSILPVISHRRKADLLEAYVGAIFQAYGFQAASKWCTMLLEPWLDLINRTPDFHQDRYLSLSGEARKRDALLQQKKDEDEKRRLNSWWRKMRDRIFSRE